MLWPDPKRFAVQVSKVEEPTLEMVKKDTDCGMKLEKLGNKYSEGRPAELGARKRIRRM